jgi:nicotinate-nucleotide adenylyltransferase
MPEIGISSTMLRERARTGRPTTYLMPGSVRRYIDEHQLYMGGPQR